jgi:hypothetical protein
VSSKRQDEYGRYEEAAASKLSKQTKKVTLLNEKTDKLVNLSMTDHVSNSSPVRSVQKPALNLSNLIAKRLSG